MSSEDVVVTLVNQDSEDLVDFHEVRQVGEDDGGESASEGDIEIEHLVGDDAQTQGGENGGEEDPNQVANITFDVRKRTLIMLWQRTILEEYYRAGMTSASMQLHSLHQEAAEKTGLDTGVVKNWIRNRRRPAAIKSAERMVEKISQGELVAPYIPPTSLTSLGSFNPSLPNSVVSFTQLRPLVTHSSSTHTSHSHRNTVVATTSGLLSQQGMGQPEAKRMCLDQSGVPTSVGFTSTHHPTPSPSLHNSPPTPLLLKIRVHGSGEMDFYEVEVPSPTHDTLLKVCAEELEVEVSHIAKVRKLPNVLVRRDRDVQRLKEGQEMEIVLKEDGMQLGFNSTAGLSMLNLTPLTTDTSPLARAGTIGLHPTSPPLTRGNSSLGLHTTSQHLNGLH